MQSFESSEPLEEKEEVFQLKKFSGFFEKRNIQIIPQRIDYPGIFNKQIIFLFVSMS
jgi:hypothetical protein